MTCYSCLYLAATYSKFATKAIFIVFLGGAIIQVQHSPLNQTTAPSETQINQHDERPNKSFLPN